MANYVEFIPDHLSEKEFESFAEKVNKQAMDEAWKQAKSEAWTIEVKNFIKKKDVVLFRKELFGMLYHFQEYEKIDDETTFVTTNGKNIITQAIDRTNWKGHDKYAKYGYKILDIEQLEGKRVWKLKMEIPFEEIEGWFSTDLIQRLNKIDNICK